MASNKLQSVGLGGAQLAGDMHKFSRFDKSIKGPTVTHMWYTRGFSALLFPFLALSLLFVWFAHCLVPSINIGSSVSKMLKFTTKASQLGK